MARLTLLHRPGHPRANERGFVIAENLSPEEVRLATEGPKRVAIVGDTHHDGVRSPVDGELIDSKRKRRAHMKRHGLADFDDMTGKWEKDKKDRDAEMAPGNRERREEVERAIHDLETGRVKVRRVEDHEVVGPDKDGREVVALKEASFTEMAADVAKGQV